MSTHNDRIEPLLLSVLFTPTSDPDVPLTHPDQVYGLCPCFVGDSGVGKSSIIKALCKRVGLPSHVVNFNCVSWEDIAGYPIMSGGSLKLTCVDKGVIELLTEEKEGVLILDEINASPDERVYSPLQRVLLDRIYAGIPIPPKVRVLAIKNPDDKAVRPNPFPAPVANRLCHLNWETPDLGDFVDWISGKPTKSWAKGTATQLETALSDNWPASWSQTSSAAVQFLQRSSAPVHKQPAGGHPDQGRAWPSLRTWYWAIRGMTAAMAINAGPVVRLEMLQGCVGEGIGKEFMEWESSLDLPSPEEALTKGFTLDTGRLDRMRVILGSVATYVKELPPRTRNKEDLIMAAWETMLKACEAGMGDIVMGDPVNTLMDNKLALSPDKPARNIVVSKVMTKIGHVAR